MDEPSVTDIVKGMNITKWSESFNIHVRAIFEVRGVLIIYVAKPQGGVDTRAPDIVVNEPHFEIMGMSTIALRIPLESLSMMLPFTSSRIPNMAEVIYF